MQRLKPPIESGFGQIAIAMAMLAASASFGQQIFREATPTPSHRVLDGSGLPRFGLPAMIQSALIKRLDQQIRSGKPIDHERLARTLNLLPIDAQTKSVIADLARINSPDDSPERATIPDDLQEIVSRQIEEFSSNRFTKPSRGNNELGGSSFNDWLASNGQLEKTFLRDRQTVKKFQELSRRFQEKHNKTKRSTRTSQQRVHRQTKPHRARAGDSMVGGDSVSKKVLESAFEAMDESSMDFLRASRGGGSGNSWKMSWLADATKSMNARVRATNRALKNFSSRNATSMPAATISDLALPEDGGRSVWTTVLVLACLGLAGVWLRKRFLGVQVAHPPKMKPFRFEASQISNRKSLVDSVDSIALEVCGPNASFQHHGEIFSKLSRYAPEAIELKSVYAQSRYASKEYKLPSNTIQDVRRILVQLCQGIEKVRNSESATP